MLQLSTQNVVISFTAMRVGVASVLESVAFFQMVGNAVLHYSLDFPHISQRVSNPVCVCATGLHVWYGTERMTAEEIPKLALCLELCTRQCTGTLPQKQAVNQLWGLSSRFRNSRFDRKCGDSPAHAHVIEALLAFLPVLLRTIPTAISPSHSGSSSADGSGSSSSSSCAPAGRDAHSKAAAASRAARVLQGRKLARGPYPVDVLFLLAGTMQVLRGLFEFLDCSWSNELAAALFKADTVTDSLFSVLSYLLRCIRQPQLLQHGPLVHAYPPFQDVLHAACQAACFASARLFQGMSAQDIDDGRHTLSKLPSRFIDALGCLACEGFASDDDAAHAVSRMVRDDSLIDLLGGSPYILLFRPAMQLLSRRIILASMNSGKGLCNALDVLATYHLQLEHDPLLSYTISYSNDSVDNFYSSAARKTAAYACLEAGGGDETCDAYFLPRVPDDTLPRLEAVLNARCHSDESGHAGSPCPETNGAWIARITAAFISLQRSSAEAGDGGKGMGLQPSPDLWHVLLLAARLASALTTQLLRGLQAGHAGCMPETMFQLSVTDPRQQHYASSVKCGRCHAVAEGATAMLLQILRVCCVAQDGERLTTSCECRNSS